MLAGSEPQLQGGRPSRHRWRRRRAHLIEPPRAELGGEGSTHVRGPAILMLLPPSAHWTVTNEHGQGHGLRHQRVRPPTPRRASKGKRLRVVDPPTITSDAIASRTSRRLWSDYRRLCCRPGRCRSRIAASALAVSEAARMPTLAWSMSAASRRRGREVRRGRPDLPGDEQRHGEPDASEGGGARHLSPAHAVGQDPRIPPRGQPRGGADADRLAGDEADDDAEGHGRRGRVVERVGAEGDASTSATSGPAPTTPPGRAPAGGSALPAPEADLSRRSADLARPAS